MYVLFIWTVILVPSVLQCMERYSESQNPRLANLARIFLDESDLVVKPNKETVEANKASETS